MAFLKNKTVNLLSAHYAFQAFAQASGGVFLLVFLIKSGLSVSETLGALALTLMLRFASRQLVLPIAKRLGLKATLMIGGFALAVQYPLTALVDGIGWALALRCLATGIGEAFYWSCFHAYFASFGDNEHRGHQISAREAAAAAIGIIAPLFGAWALETMGPVIAFSVIGLVQAAGAIPLRAAPTVAVKPEAPGWKKASQLGSWLYVANGWFAGAFVIIWQLVLFLTLGESLSTFGGTMAIAAVAGAIGGLLIGRGIDRGLALRSTILVFSGIAAVALLRAASLDSPQWAIAANALGTFAICFYVPVLMTPVYNLAKGSPCSLRFHISAENHWDIGCLAVTGVAALFHTLDIPLKYVLVLTLPACLAHVLLLRYYFRTRDISQNSGVIS